MGTALPNRIRSVAAAATASAAVLALVGCTADAPPGPGADDGRPSPTRSLSPSPGTSSDNPTSPGTPTSPDAPAGTPTPSRTSRGPEPGGPEPGRPTDPGGPDRLVRFRAGAALRDVQTLADGIGPRLATGVGFRRAADLVHERLAGLGYSVRRQRFGVPAGDSWGVPVEAGRSLNVVATPPGFAGTRPHLVLGAHLDTVAVSPGAEDNASGVAVLLEVARLLGADPPRLPVAVVAFGGEEPRGPGDALHHFGSRHYVRQLTPRRLAAIRGMVSVDRVGVGAVVPVCTGPLSSPRVQRTLLSAARRAGIPADPCMNTASDHWSFEKAGVAVARLGSTSYAAYHSAEDVPGLVNRRQLGRTGRLVWQWLRSR